MARPDNVNDLHVLWAIRDIPSAAISPIGRLLLYEFLSIIGNRESCWNNLQQLADKVGISVRSLINHLKILERLNFIQIKRPSKSGRGHANEYFLNYNLILAHSKHAESAPISKVKHANSAPFKRETMQKTTLKHAESAHQDIQREIHKSREREPLSFFEPDKQSKALASQLGLNLDEEIKSFTERHRGEKSQYEFERWLKNSREYKDKKSAKDNVTRINPNETRSTVPFWGKGHPSWEALHGNNNGSNTKGSEASRDHARGNGVLKAKDYLF